MSAEHFNVIIVGAGISGIGAAYHLQQKCPGKRYLIVEGRNALGGTWDLFRYPGIRSDSDMYTLGYIFKPWTHAKSIADAPNILEYLEETVRENHIDQNIRFGHKVLRASWSDENARWEIEVQRNGQSETNLISCSFLHMCSGYYNYTEGYTPVFEGAEDFRGKIVHPQLWTDDIDYHNKKVVVIGSGATAVTLVPALADSAAHVTMLQRSPTYVVSAPSEDKIAGLLSKYLPVSWAYWLVRWRNILVQRLVYDGFQKYPKSSKKRLINRVRDELGPDYDVARHFTPSYNPWDQRLCLVPDSDMFAALRTGQASVVTEHIERFTESGVLLKTGEELEADLIVTATGLNLQFLSDVEFTINGEQLEPNKALIYRGMMVSGVPNMALSMGYTNASWTLKCDLTSDYVCRLLKHMDRHGYSTCIPQRDETELQTEPYMGLAAGYIKRSEHLFPQQGSRAPWRLHQNYLKDLFLLRYSKLEDGVMAFTR